MTKQQLIKKLERIQDLLREVTDEDIEELIESNQEKIENIQEKAYERESGENTEREEERICELEELNENLDALRNELYFDIEDLIDNYLG